tara:strand:+ start:145 stop:588 length:444 start_codon:yes stop_codon:yes gene_type:complete
MRSRGVSVVLLDGDKLREVFGTEISTDEGHDRNSRLSLAMKYSRLCLNLVSQGLTVVIATISLFREVHKWNRRYVPGYFEVYLRVPMKELRRRDPKGIYNRFSCGEIKNVAGLDLEIEEPETPDWIVDFDPERSSSDIATELDKFLR